MLFQQTHCDMSFTFFPLKLTHHWNLRLFSKKKKKYVNAMLLGGFRFQSNEIPEYCTDRWMNEQINEQIDEQICLYHLEINWATDPS